MYGDDAEALHVRGRSIPELRRSAFLMCGDWALADELARSSLARLVAVQPARAVADPDVFAYADLMASFQRRRPAADVSRAARPCTRPARAPALDVAERPCERTRRPRPGLRARAGARRPARARAALPGRAGAAALRRPGDRRDRRRARTWTTSGCWPSRRRAWAPWRPAGRRGRPMARRRRTAGPTSTGRRPAGAGSTGGCWAGLRGEPPPGPAWPPVNRRADARAAAGPAAGAGRRCGRRSWSPLLGYALTTALLPGQPRPRSPQPAVPAPAPAVDPVLAVLAPPSTRRATGSCRACRPRGAGWRQYAVLDARRASRAAWSRWPSTTRRHGLCFPVLAEPDACALPDRTRARHRIRPLRRDRDVDWQVHQAIARRRRTAGRWPSWPRASGAPAVAERRASRR